jgi:hypothetical protein
VARQPFLEPALFERLRAEYPGDALFERNTRLHARAGRDLYRGDPLFDEFLAGAPAWREFYAWVNSPAYVRLVLDLFGEDLARFGCRVDPQKAAFHEYVEPREALTEVKGFRRLLRRVRGAFGTPTDPNELFVRFDLGQARAGYAKEVHCDLPNRLVSMIMYFSDTEEEGLQGGDLRLHEHVERRAPAEYERYPREERTRVIATLRPRKNLGVLFLCSNNSYHSVTAMRGDGRRNFTYFNVSSRAERIW